MPYGRPLLAQLVGAGSAVAAAGDDDGDGADLDEELGERQLGDADGGPRGVVVGGSRL